MLVDLLSTIEPLTTALGWALVHSIWQCAAIWLIVRIALVSLRRSSAGARYAACGLGMFAIAVAPVISFFYLAGAPAGWLDFDAPGGAAGSAAGQTVHAVRVGSAVLPWLVLAWLSGTVILLVRLAAGWRQIHRLRRRALRQPLCEWQDVAEALARRLGLTSAVRVVEAAAANVPVVIGWLRPVIILPVCTMTGLTREQIELVLAHELAHIRRHDYLVNLLQGIVESVMFYHPAVWAVSGRMREEREYCCDDLAVSVCGDPVSYARMLTELETLRGPAAGLVLASSGGDLMNRVSRLLQLRTGPRRLGAACSGACGTVALMICAAGGLFSPDDAVPVSDAGSVDTGVVTPVADDVAPDMIEALASLGYLGDAGPVGPDLDATIAAERVATCMVTATAAAEASNDFSVDLTQLVSGDFQLVLVPTVETATIQLDSDAALEQFVTLELLSCAPPEAEPASLIDLTYDLAVNPADAVDPRDPEATACLSFSLEPDADVELAAPCEHVLQGDLAACTDECSVQWIAARRCDPRGDGAARGDLQIENWVTIQPTLLTGRVLRLVLTPRIQLEREVVLQLQAQAQADQDSAPK